MKVLVGDIGATNSKFGLFEIGKEVILEKSPLLPTNQFTSFRRILMELKGLVPEVVHAKKVLLGVAGPVEEGIAYPPNIPFGIEAKDVKEALGIEDVVLVNDMVLYSWACLSPQKAHFTPVREGIEGAGNLCVVAPGTGFGQAAIVDLGQGEKRIITSEGGHSPFPFEPEEADFQRYLKGKGIEATFDTIVSGPGLLRLYAFLTNQEISPHEISAVLRKERAIKALFAKFLGRATRHLALTFLAKGGIFLGGGVLLKNPDLLNTPEFEQEFTRSQKMRQLLHPIPMWLINHELATLWGGAWRVHMDHLERKFLGGYGEKIR